MIKKLKTDVDKEELKLALLSCLKSEHPERKGKQVISYKYKVIGWFERGVLKPMCLLCETKENVVCKAYYIHEEKRNITVIVYFLCGECYDELQAQNEQERKSIVSKVIEPKIETCLKTGTFFEA